MMESAFASVGLSLNIDGSEAHESNVKGNYQESPLDLNFRFKMTYSNDLLTKSRLPTIPIFQKKGKIPFPNYFLKKSAKLTFTN